MPGPDLDRDVGRVLGQRYRLEERIGVGASAVVYRATDLNLSRSVAIKQLKPELSGDARFIKLFRSEAHLAGQLDHHNVVTIHDWSADDAGVDGGAYIVTEYLTGGTLRQLLDREGTLPVGEAARIGLQVARGLRAAHDAGMVHRDIKPGNILFGADGRICIGDFGIARAVAVAAWTEPEGHLIGTARYASPEQGHPGDVTDRSDVYSLAVCLIEMVTGEVPLVGESAIATMVMRREHDLPVDPALGDLAELVSWAGLAEWAGRPTADQVVEQLTAICGLPGSSPAAMVDLVTASHPMNGPAPAPPNGELELGRFPAQHGWSDEHEDEHEDENEDHRAEDGRWAEGGEEPADRPGSGDDASRAMADDRTVALDAPIDDPAPPHGLDRSRAPIVAAVVALLAATAVAVGWLLAGFNQPQTEVIAVALPSWSVPDFDGMTPEEVRSAVAPYRWTVSVVDERRTDGTDAGQLLEQRPAPGEVLGPGASIELVLSLGPELRAVPELVALSEDEARQAIDRARLATGATSRRADEDAEVGVVLEATIAGGAAVPGTEYPTGTAIDLVISDGPAPRIVPDLAGLTADGARQALAAVGLDIDLRQEHSESVPEGRVIGFAPAAGAELERGSAVSVTVSLGLPFVTVPDLAGRPILEAAAELGDLGFEVRIEGATDGDVLGTRPQAGSTQRLGANVTIVSTKE